eukprot:scaffold182152_cov32-Tisochrysis_lutea.AAC.1
MASSQRRRSAVRKRRWAGNSTTHGRREGERKAHAPHNHDACTLHTVSVRRSTGSFHTREDGAVNRPSLARYRRRCSFLRTRWRPILGSAPFLLPIDLAGRTYHRKQRLDGSQGIAGARGNRENLDGARARRSVDRACPRDAA